MNEESLFHEAAGLADPTERAAFLDRACAGQPELRAAVEALLAAHAAPGPFLDRPAAPGATAGLPAGQPAPPVAGGPALGSRVGPYKLLQKLGEGGMGTVWLAEQHQPVQRRVALKLIKPGLDSAQVLARFEQERQALALMDHPHIAKVLDAGSTPDGRPYFVMELVKGLPITKYCDQEQLTPRERLELFAPVCQAVQHAHQKGIIHRDLKPRNVLVGLYDGQPVVKVIDFGVAKATAQKLSEGTVFTEVGQMVGTLEYMAPEQAELNNLDIDTRADIYSLGVLLYELLTGSPPFTAKQLRGAAFSEMLRLIREVEPPKPSTKLSSSEELPSIAARRKLEPKKLTRLITGELDWIVMKCLEKERGRRYETANQLALELQRYLADEPVLAGPPSAAYRLRKFVRRNRGPVAAAALVLAALVAGIVGMTAGLLRAGQARRAEAEQRMAAEQAQAREVAQRARAEQGEKASRLAEQGAKAAEEQEARQRAKAEQEEKAARLAEKEAKLAQKRSGEVTDYLIKAFRSPDPAIKSSDLTVLDVLDAAVERLKEDWPESPLTQAELLHAIGQSYLGLGATKKAVATFARALELWKTHRGPDHADTLGGMNSLAMAYREDGQLEMALALGEQTLERSKRVLGTDHPQTVSVRQSLGLNYFRTQRFAEAEPHLEAWLVVQRSRWPADDPQLAYYLNLIGECRVRQMKFAAAEVPLRESLAIFEKKQPGSVLRSDTESLLGAALAGQKKYADAEPLLVKSATVLKNNAAKVGPANRPLVLAAVGRVVDLYVAWDRPDDAARWRKDLEALDPPVKPRQRRIG
jgi:serine/threonine-protein kinase